MEEVKTEFKEKTIAVDFDGVIHQYSNGFQGLHNAYDPPMPGVFEGLDELKKMGYRLIIVSSRPTEAIKKWLIKYNMENYFEEVSNIKHPARYYIDDHAVRFEKNDSNSWKNVVQFIKNKEVKND